MPSWAKLLTGIDAKRCEFHLFLPVLSQLAVEAPSLGKCKIQEAEPVIEKVGVQFGSYLINTKNLNLDLWKNLQIKFCTHSHGVTM